MFLPFITLLTINIWIDNQLTWSKASNPGGTLVGCITALWGGGAYPWGGGAYPWGGGAYPGGGGPYPCRQIFLGFQGSSRILDKFQGILEIPWYT